MIDLVAHVEETILKRKLLRQGDPLLVAVSGGADSMVLLHVLAKLAQRFFWKLTVAHLNHGLRGRSSAADERLVIRTAERSLIPHVKRNVDVRKEAKSSKLSIEMTARDIRHKFLADTAMNLGIKSIALAHHADDQVELFLLRLLRGSGSEGLAGMKWLSPSPRDPEITLIRPLLDLPKRVLRQYAIEQKITFREDASNDSLDIQRNRIRNELLPLIRRNYQPAIDRAILRTMDILEAEAELSRSAAVKWLISNRRTSFAHIPVAVQRRCILVQLEQRRIKVDYDLVERLRTQPGYSAKVSPQLTVKLDTSGELLVMESGRIAGPNPTRRVVALRGEKGKIDFAGLRIQWRISSRKALAFPKFGAGSEWFDADRIGSRIVLRHWHRGDRFQPSGMKSSVKLQNLFTNAKVLRHQRHNLVVGESKGGSVFWVQGLRIAEQFKVNPKTIRLLHWQWKSL